MYHGKKDVKKMWRLPSFSYVQLSFFENKWEPTRTINKVTKWNQYTSFGVVFFEKKNIW